MGGSRFGSVTICSLGGNSYFRVVVKFLKKGIEECTSPWSPAGNILNSRKNRTPSELHSKQIHMIFTTAIAPPSLYWCKFFASTLESKTGAHINWNYVGNQWLNINTRFIYHYVQTRISGYMLQNKQRTRSQKQIWHCILIFSWESDHKQKKLQRS